MKRNSIFLFAVMAATIISMSSCSSEETEALEKKENPAELKITASMTPLLDVSTRAAHNLQGTELEDFTKIGIYVWYANYTAAKTTAPVYNGYDNISVTGHTGSGPWELTPSQTLGFPIDNGDVDVYLYAPYKNSPTQTDMRMDHTVALDQSLKEDYVASDFLYGKATAKYTGAVSPEVDKTARVTMYHAMSKLIFKVVNSGVDPANMTNISLQQVYTKTTINMSVPISTSLTFGSTSDNVNSASGKANIIVWGSPGTGAVSTSDAMSNGVAVIVPPQTTESDTKVSVSTNDGSSTFTAVANFNGKTLKPGKVYTYNLKLIGTGVTVSLVSITDWDDSDSPTGTDADLDFNSWSTGS